jgi:transcriptional regulator with XRE-family HTH domain
MRPNKKTTAKKLDPSLSLRNLYGAELRFQREKANLSQAELAELVYVTASFIANLESGRRRIQPELAAMLDRVLNTDGFFVRNIEAGRSTPFREHFAEVAELETVALTIKEWEPLLIPGLAQTPAYAEAVIRAYDPFLRADAAVERQQARLARAKIFASPRPPEYWVILDEAAIRRPVGGPAVMAEQLRHLAAMVRENQMVLQVLPFSAGAHVGMEGAVRLMTFEDDAPMVYFQAQETGSLVDNPATVKRGRLTYDLLGAAALSPEASLTLIEAAAEEYDHGQQAQPDLGEVA